MSHRSFLPLVACALLSSMMPAQSGNGGNGDLEPSPMAIGTNFDLKVTGGANQPWFLFISDAAAQISIPPTGTVWIDPFSPAFGQLASGTLPAGGSVTLSAPIPNDPAWLALLLFMQGVVLDPAQPSGVALTRPIRLQFQNQDSFANIPDLAGPRALATSDLLRDGRVLVTGGGTGSLTSPNGANSTELYQPYTRSWNPGPTMSIARGFHASAVLNDGRVLLTGGVTSGGTVSDTCEIFDPATDSFSPAASMGTPRAAHAATLLANGKVLVTGGTSNFTPAPASTTPFGDVLGQSKDTGEVYDPVANTWTPVSNTMNSKRFGHTQTLLNDGRVVCISGINGAGVIPVVNVEAPTWTTTTSLYNPATNSFANGPAISVPRTAHRATKMPNGEVFVSGGFAPTLFLGTVIGITSTNSAVKLNATATSFTAAGTLPAGCLSHGQVLLKNGKCHVSGGTTIALSGTTLALGAIDSCVTRIGGATTLTTTTSLPAARGAHLAVRMWDGTVLIAGGTDSAGTPVASCLLYTPGP